MSCHDEKCEVLGCTCGVISSVEEMPLHLLRLLLGVDEFCEAN